MFVGVDYHKKYSIATKMDSRGRVLEQVRLPNTADELTAYVDGLPKRTKIAVEATGNWYYFYELLEDKSPQVCLAHPLKTRAIAEAKIKTDKIDSTILAHLLRAELLPKAYIPPREIRDIREVLRYRASLIALRTSVKNKIHAILSKNGIDLEVANIFGKKALKRLGELPLRSCYRLGLDGYIGLGERINELIEAVSAEIERIAKDNEQARLLTTIPGIAYYSALLIVSEIGDISRFPSAKKLCSYAGLVPSVHSSGGKTRYGSITKQGSKWLRWILVELSHHFSKNDGRLMRLYMRTMRRHGKNTARVAVAREMLKIMFYMLRDKRAFARENPAVSLGS